MYYYFQEQHKNELRKLKDQMKNMIDINEYNILKHEFKVLTAKHREILHFGLFKVPISNITYILYNIFNYFRY